MGYLNEDVLYDDIEEKYKNAQGKAREAYSDVLDTICAMPRAEVEVVRHGEWIWEKKYSDYYCSLCHDWNLKTPNYCPNCGAKNVRR